MISGNISFSFISIKVNHICRVCAQIMSVYFHFWLVSIKVNHMCVHVVSKKLLINSIATKHDNYCVFFFSTADRHFKIIKIQRQT